MLKRRAAWPRGTRWLAGGIAVVVLGLVIAWALFVPIADWLAHHDVGSVSASLHETAVDNARGRLLTLGAGLFAAAALVFTARNFILSREGQVTDRYTKAIEQLGSDKLDVRIGGIYALERVARDSERDHPTVIEVLTAFIREHSHEQWPPSDRPVSREQERSTGPDVQAALTVVGRRDRDRDLRSIDLTGAVLPRANLISADLLGADLTGVNLTGADLRGTILTAADLTGANLAGACLIGALLRGVDLEGADLHDAFLSGVNLTYVVLRNADLRGALLNGVNFTGADLSDAHLNGANLSGTDLSGADLTDADLGGASLYNVKWRAGVPPPSGWELDPDFGSLRRSSAGSTPTDAN